MLPDEFVKAHLNHYGQNWHNLWQLFVEAQGDNDVLTIAAKAYLKQLRLLIKQTFIDHPVENVVEQIKLPADSLLMVRSSGEEDTAEVANPGGNKSIAAVALEKLAISRAIGGVFASCFSEKSQRN